MKKNLNLYLLKAYYASARVTHDKIFLTLSLFSLLFVLINTAASAQTQPTGKQIQTVTGVVRDENQEVLVGVSVSVKGTTQGVVTDENGRFSLSVDLVKHDLLVFSYLAKQTIELSLAEKGTTIDLTLQDDASYFTELVVMGEATSDQVYTEKKSSRKKLKRKD